MRLSSSSQSSSDFGVARKARSSAIAVLIEPSRARYGPERDRCRSPWPRSGRPGQRRPRPPRAPRPAWCRGSSEEAGRHPGGQGPAGARSRRSPSARAGAARKDQPKPGGSRSLQLQGAPSGCRGRSGWDAADQRPRSSRPPTQRRGPRGSCKATRRNRAGAQLRWRSVVPGLGPSCSPARTEVAY
jgi:hypothetical protein